MTELQTRVRSAHDPEAVAEAVVLLQAGEPVVFPTDTVYGVGAHAFVGRAVASLYEVKDRLPDKYIPLLLSGSGDMPQVAQPVPSLAWTLAKLFWPGALTLVLPKGPRVLDIISAGPGVAVRVPAHAVVQEMIRRLGAPLAATSANLSGRPSSTTVGEVLAQLDGRIPLILDGGPCEGGIPSTVLDLTQSPPLVLREGGICAEALEPYLADRR
jgi:L-threonylcarbamoyladenylate synthase